MPAEFGVAAKLVAELEGFEALDEHHAVATASLEHKSCVSFQPWRRPGVSMSIVTPFHRKDCKHVKGSCRYSKAADEHQKQHLSGYHAIVHHIQQPSDSTNYNRRTSHAARA